MKRIIPLVALLAVFVALIAFFNAAPSALAQQDKPTCSLEGVIIDSEGEPLMLPQSVSPQIFLYSNGKPIMNEQGWEGFMVKRGGFYHIDKLKPGVYSVVITPILGEQKKRDRPKRYMNVALLDPSKAFQLNVQLKKGQAMEVVGENITEYPEALPLSEILKKMQDQIDALKKENEDLKKRVEKLEKK